jgi:signal transduction histidine kinase
MAQVLPEPMQWSLSLWFRSPRYLLTLFLAIMLVLSASLSWLGWRLLKQDRALESQRIQERLDNAADLIAASLLRKFSESKDRLTGLLALSDSDLAARSSQLGGQGAGTALIIVFRPQAVDAYPRAALLYYPFLPTAKEPPASMFEAGEVAEFQQKDFAKAIAVFRELSQSKDPAIRAGGLLRLGRNLRKAQQSRAALDIYDQLDQMGATPVGGLPAELLARYARCTLLDELKRTTDVKREAGLLHAELHDGRWKLDRAAYRFYTQETSRWYPPDPELQVHKQDAVPTATAVELLWESWQRIRRGEDNATGQRSVWILGRPVLLVWRASSDRLVALVAGEHYLEQEWLSGLRPLMDRQSVRLALTDAEGHTVLAQFSGTSVQQATRNSAETQLPWTLRVVSRDPQAEWAQERNRRTLLLLAFILLFTFVLVGSYLIARAVTRELEVARLQSDFVSAVSHEFRTPLASLWQLSEMLSDGRVPSETRRQEYYEGLRRASERLYRLVEGLLDFGRMQAGVQQYRFELLDTGSFFRRVVEEFAQEIRERGYQVEITQQPHLAAVKADRDALTRALWNLLDNAVKYSPQNRTIWAKASCENGRVAISVSDKGLGIAPHERKRIFKKFVRAASAEIAGAKGTGLGLTMVEHIVAAHGGQMHIESEHGVGSTFTILLPSAKE